MPRVKRGTRHVKHRHNILEDVKGYRWGRKSKIKHAITARLKAGVHARQDRRKKKGQFRRWWQIRLNAAARENQLTYSRLIDALKKKNIALDRKILSDLAVNQPKVFTKIIELIK